MVREQRINHLWWELVYGLWSSSLTFCHEHAGESRNLVIYPVSQRTLSDVEVSVSDQGESGGGVEWISESVSVQGREEEY